MSYLMRAFDSSVSKAGAINVTERIKRQIKYP